MNVALIVASAILLPAALPNEFLPWGATLPGLIALVPAFLAVYRTPSRRTASRLGVLFGVISTAVGNYWLAFFGEFSLWTIGGTVLGYAGYNYILFGFLHFVAHGGASGPAMESVPDGGHGGHGGAVPSPALLRPSSTLRPVWIAVVWTAYEYLKSVGFLGYPWGLIAYPLANWNNVAQVAEIGGVWILSFLAAYANAAAAEVFLAFPGERGRAGHHGAGRRSPAAGMHGRHLAAAAGLIITAALFGTVRLPTIQPTETRSMLLVQQNVDSWQPGRFSSALARAQELTLKGLDGPSGRDSVDAVVWSETALRRPYRTEDPFYRSEPAQLPFSIFLALIDVPLVTGAPMPAGDDPRDATNSALVIAPDGELLGSYGKQQLVPFAESIPFWHLEQVKWFFRQVVGLYGTWVPGADSRPLPLPMDDGSTLWIGTPICFEDAFGWVPRELVRNGADLLVNLTNNSWSRRNSAQTQHFVAARLRTIELRTTLVRGTNSGLSTVVDARGVTSQSLPMFEGTAARVTVPIYPPQWTLYRAWGDWLGLLAVVGALGRVAFLAWTHRRGALDRPTA